MTLPAKDLTVFAPDLAKLLSGGRTLNITNDQSGCTMTLLCSSVLKLTQRGATPEEAMAKLTTAFDLLYDSARGVPLMFTIVTEDYTDNDGNPSKKVTIADDTDIIVLRLGAVEAGQLAAALRPNGKNIKIEGGHRV